MEKVSIVTILYIIFFFLKKLNVFEKYNKELKKYLVRFNLIKSVVLRFNLENLKIL